MKLANTIINHSNTNRIFKCNLHNFFFRWVHATFDWTTTPHESTGDEAEEILQLSGIFSVLYVLRTCEGLLCAWDSSVTPENCAVWLQFTCVTQRASVVPKDTRNILKLRSWSKKRVIVLNPCSASKVDNLVSGERGAFKAVDWAWDNLTSAACAHRLRPEAKWTQAPYKHFGVRAWDLPWYAWFWSARFVSSCRFLCQKHFMKERQYTDKLQDPIRI